MIGNDIVDLEHSRRESNWQRRGFLDKVFTPDEQVLIQSAMDPETMVWALWSMKESAYKLIVRQTNRPFFAPRNLACHSVTRQEHTLEGRIFYRNEYHTQSILTPGYIAGLAWPSDRSQPFVHQIVSFQRTDYRHQHEHIRLAVQRFLSSRLPLKRDDIQVQKDEAGHPFVRFCSSAGTTTTIPISLSHHGHYGAFALPID